MGLKDFFKNNKAKTEADNVITNTEAKMKVSQTRSRMVELESAMKSIKFEDIRRKVPEDKISTADFARYQRNFDIMLRKLSMQSSTELVQMNTDTIDEKMLYFVEHFDKALREGNKNTADTFMKGLQYGIVRGHEEIKSTDAGKANEIMFNRSSRLDQYRTIADLCMHIDSLEKDKRLKQADYNAHLANFEEIKKDLEKEIALNPHVVERIDKVGENHISPVDAEAYILASKMGQVTSLHKQLVEIKQNIAILENNINSTNDSINMAKSSLMDSDNKIDDLTIEELDKYNREHLKRMKQLTEESERLDELFEKLTDGMDQIFSDPKMIDSIIKKKMDYDLMVEQHKQEIKQREEGMKNYQEQQKQQENEQKEQQLLNN